MKIYGRESANGDFPCAKLQNAKKKIAEFFFDDYEKKTEFVLINIFSPAFVPNLVTLAWKMSPGMPKEAGSLNGPLCAYLIRQNLHNRTVRDLRAMNIIATFQNDPWKNCGRESANGDFLCAKLENAKKNSPIFFWRLWQNPEHILILLFRPTYVPNDDFSLKMSSGMSKEAGSLNGPLGGYLMRQNLRDRTRPRS